LAAEKPDIAPGLPPASHVRPPREGDMGKDPKIPLDREGLRKLGTALLIKRREFLLASRGYHEFVRENFPQMVDEATLEREEAATNLVVDALDVLGGPCARAEVVRLGVSSFHYDREHLTGHPVLAACLGGRPVDARRPIVDWKFWGTPLSALEGIFVDEAEILHYGDRPTPQVLTQADVIPRLSVANLASKPSRQGKPPGSSKNRHHYDAIEPLYRERIERDMKKLTAAREAAAEAGIRLDRRPGEPVGPKDWVYGYQKLEPSVDSALRSIVQEMSKRENQGWKSGGTLN
jgi:hypothetical protein